MFSLNILDGKILEVETNVVTWYGGLDLDVMHLDGLDFSGRVHWYNSDYHSRFRSTVLDTYEGNCANTTYLVDVLERVVNLVDDLEGTTE